MNPVFYADTIGSAGYKRQILQVDQKPSLYIVAANKTAYLPQTETAKHKMY